MKILAIETSCDETSVAVIEAYGKLRQPRFRVLSNIVSSQIKLHAQYGGVVPGLAAREHEKNLPRVFKLACRQAKLVQPQKSIKAIAVTYGYGLLPALVQGVSFAKTLAKKWHKPLVGVNHMEGHIYSNWLKPIGVNDELPISNFKLFPAVVLIVSGGHTALLLMKGHGQYEILGETLDDAAGECFDKGARLFNLGYPGGPVIDKLSQGIDPKIFSFPSPMISSKNFQFSFSGLKTSLLYFLRDHQYNFKGKLSTAKQKLRQEIAAGFQHAIVKVLTEKTLRAAVQFQAKTILVGGGVAANSYLQNYLRQIAKEKGIKIPIMFPGRSYITDNAAMIAAAGYIRYSLGVRHNPDTLDASADLRLV
jgi:N6-L-threonylcarbamoyladenine synthase